MTKQTSLHTQENRGLWFDGILLKPSLPVHPPVPFLISLRLSFWTTQFYFHSHLKLNPKGPILWYTWWPFKVSFWQQSQILSHGNNSIEDNRPNWCHTWEANPLAGCGEWSLTTSTCVIMISSPHWLAYSMCSQAASWPENPGKGLQPQTIQRCTWT